MKVWTNFIQLLLCFVEGIVIEIVIVQKPCRSDEWCWSVESTLKLLCNKIPLLTSLTPRALLHIQAVLLCNARSSKLYCNSKAFHFIKSENQEDPNVDVGSETNSANAKLEGKEKRILVVLSSPRATDMEVDGFTVFIKLAWRANELSDYRVFICIFYPQQKQKQQPSNLSLYPIILLFSLHPTCQNISSQSVFSSPASSSFSFDKSFVHLPITQKDCLKFKAWCSLYRPI